MEVLEVFINCILYTRNVYPSAIFKKRRKYGTAVYACIYPPLNDYITNVLRSARELRSTKQLHKVEVVLFKDEHTILERFVFEMNGLPISDQHDDKYLIAFENELRNILLGLDEKFKNLISLPSDVLFKVNLYTTESAFVKLSNNAKLQVRVWRVCI